MPKATKMTNFFHENRRECVLGDYRVLQTTGEEKRLKMEFAMPISNKSIVGMPEWVSDPWTVMEKEKSLTLRSNIDVMLEGMTLDFYSTGSIKHRALTSSGAKLGGFHLLTAGEGEKKETALHFTVYLPGSIQLRDWAWENHRQTFFAEFAYSQSEIDFGAEGDEDDDDAEYEPVANDVVHTGKGEKKKKPFDPAAIQRAAGNKASGVHPVN